MAAPAGRLAFVKPALLTGAAFLLAFGTLHAALITWVVDWSADTPLVARLARMFAMPILIGSPFALATAFAGAWAWRRNAATRLASWRWGPVLASALLPALAVSVMRGPTGAEPEPWVLAALVSGSITLPALAGALVAGSRWGLLSGLAGLPVGAVLGIFVVDSPLRGLVLLFIVSLFALLVASGPLMARLVGAGREPFSPRTSDPPA